MDNHRRQPKCHSTTQTSKFFAILVVVLATGLPIPANEASQQPRTISVGFGKADISPKMGKTPVYIAGFGHNRKAEKNHDPLMARAIVLNDGTHKIALVSIDVVGLFLENVQNIRRRLTKFDYVLVSATHNHEGPDTLGLWGTNPFQSGVDPEYLKLLEARVVKAVKQADQSAVSVTAKIGTTHGPELLHDGRLPIVKHDELTAIVFHQPKKTTPAGMVIGWHCHPETLGSKFKEVSADFVGPTVTYLKKKYHCPVVYFNGSVGGLMTSLRVPVRDEQGKPLRDGTWAKTKRYGELVGRLADKALAKAKPIRLHPLALKTRKLFLPIDNKLYVFAWHIGVFKRQGYYWTGDIDKAKPVHGKIMPKDRVCVQTEIGWLNLGQLEIAAIPGEIYPEVVLGKVQDPADPAADFPKTNAEPAIYHQLKSPHRMLIGLANDELGYIIPKRQWDQKPPFCYGRKKTQYGEINSLGPDTAPLLCGAFQAMLKDTTSTKKRAKND